MLWQYSSIQASGFFLCFLAQNWELIPDFHDPVEQIRYDFHPSLPRDLVFTVFCFPWHQEKRRKVVYWGLRSCPFFLEETVVPIMSSLPGYEGVQIYSILDTAWVCHCPMLLKTGVGVGPFKPRPNLVLKMAILFPKDLPFGYSLNLLPFLIRTSVRRGDLPHIVSQLAGKACGHWEGT